MTGPFLRGKRHWYEGDTRAAVAALEEITGPLEIGDERLARSAGGPYESLILGVLGDDLELTVPFATAAGRLWAAFPGRYAIDALGLRRTLAPADVEWLYGGAADGLLTSDPAEHDLVARVVLPDELPAVVERERLEALMASAQAAGAWEAFVAEHPDLVANQLLDRAFYPARVMRGPMALDRLDRIAELQPGLLDAVADTLEGWDAEEVVRGGMRSDGPPECRDHLVEALRSRDFDVLPSDCLP